MSIEDRQWFEERLQELRRDTRADIQAVEQRLTKQIEQLREDTRAEVREIKESMTARLNNHSDRIRSLENHRAYLAGIGGVLGFAASWIKDILTGKAGSP